MNIFVFFNEDGSIFLYWRRNRLQSFSEKGMKTCAVEDDFSLHMTEEKKELADYYIAHYDEVM